MYEKMRAERQRLAQEIASLKARLKEFPEGKLVCVRGGRYTKWYRSDGHKSVYIPKKQKSWQNGWLRKSICRRGWKSFCRNKKLLISI